MAGDFVPNGELLPDDAVLVRAGECAAGTLRKSIDKYRAYCEDRGRPAENALSAEYRLGCDADEIASRGHRMLRGYRKMRQTTVRRLAGLGAEVLQDGRLGHARIKLGDPLTDDDLEAISNAFDAPQPNPAWGLE